MEKSHVAQVADELEKLGFTAEEADQLSREKHRALVDTLKSGRTTAGKIAEQIIQHETEPVGQIAPPAETVEEFPAHPPGSTAPVDEKLEAPADPANVGGISPDAQLDAFETSNQKA